jgi:pimeloyl-ACP methyl ester carboxylesterase
MVAIAVAAAPIDTPDDDLAGARAIRIEEPVFKGHAYVYEAGKDHARSILLVHGLGDEGARDYRHQIPWLAQSFHVIAVDLPGFARSTKSNALYTPGNYAAFLKFVADRFVRGPFVLVGHSLGGVVALRYAALYPNDVERLVVVDTPGILYRYALSSHYISRLGLDFLPSGLDPLEPLTQLARKLLGRVERFSNYPEIILSSGILREKVLGGDPNRIAGLAAGLEDMSKVLPRIKVETLVIWGREDKIAQARIGRLLAGKLARAQLVVIEQAGHEPMLETPERFRAALEPFLDKGLAPPPRAAEMRKQGKAGCENKRNLVYEGEYDTLSLNACKGIRISNARVRELRIEASTVTIENSDIGGGEVGLSARGATIEMTGGRIKGEVAIMASGSRLDLAGVEVLGRTAAMQAPEPSTVVFSICHVRSPYTNGDVHGYYAVVEDNPL